MVKSFEEFINEGISKSDVYPYMLKGVLDVLNTHSESQDVADYITYKIDGKVATVTVSSEPNKKISELNNDITFYILPPNQKPNIGVAIGVGGRRKDTPADKFQLYGEGKLSDFGKDIFNNVKNVYKNMITLYLVVMY
jgi:hypothetical protein